MLVQLFVGVTRFIVQYRIIKLLEDELFYRLPAISFHILTPSSLESWWRSPLFRGAILLFEKSAEDFRNFSNNFLSSKIRLSEKPGQAHRY